MKTRVIKLNEEQGRKLKAIMDRKKSYHDAIRKYGPASEEAEELRKKLFSSPKSEQP